MQDVELLVMLYLGGHRNVLKATVDVPLAGEVTFHCTHLDHLDEDWRMKQINAIIQSDDDPHILAGGLNSLDETDYSAERWTDIVKVKLLMSFFSFINISFKENQSLCKQRTAKVFVNKEQLEASKKSKNNVRLSVL